MLNIREILNSQHNAKRMPFWCLKPILWQIFFDEKTIFCSPKTSMKNSCRPRHWVKTRFPKKKGCTRNVFWASNRDFENKRFWEWGVRICGEAVLFDFRCVFARTYFKLRYCGFAKLLKKISVNFNGVCGFLILVCAVFVRISVRFCAESHAPSPPYAPLFWASSLLYLTIMITSGSVQFKLFILYKHTVVYQSCFPAQFEHLHKQLYQSCFRFSLTFFFSFFAKRELITEADKESCATYNLWLLRRYSWK